MSPKLLGWNVGVKCVSCSWGGEASCSFAEYSSAQMGLSGSPKCCLSGGCKKSPIRRVPLCCASGRFAVLRFPTGGCGASIVYLLAGHCGVCVGKARNGWTGRKMCCMGPRALEHLRALLYTNVRDGMKPRYRILRRSLGSVFMLPIFWFDSEGALATETVLIKLESPECNVVDRTGLMNVERCKVNDKRPSSWLRRPKLSFASIWSHLSVQNLCTPVSCRSWESRFPGALGLALPFKHLYSLQIREMFAKDDVLGPLNLFDWKRVGLMIVYLCGFCPLFFFFAQSSMVPRLFDKILVFVADHPKGRLCARMLMSSFRSFNCLVSLFLFSCFLVR